MSHPPNARSLTQNIVALRTGTSAVFFPEYAVAIAMHEPLSILWFRLDLRLADNPALHAAIQRGGPVIPVFISAPEEEMEVLTME